MLFRSANSFVDTLRPDDRAMVIDFDDKVFLVQDLTHSHEDLKAAITSTEAIGGTAIYDVLHATYRKIGKLEGRKAIVLLSDGEDTSSLVDFDEVLELAKRSDTVIYTIGLRSRDIRTRRGFREADFVLRQLAQETGGRSFFPERVEDLAAI